MADSNPTITESAYGAWLEPGAAVTLVNDKTGNYQKSYAAILKRGGAGLIRAVAKNIDRHDLNGKTVRLPSFSIVSPDSLKNWHDNYRASDLTIWTTGDCDLLLDTTGRYGYTSNAPRLCYFGIRFEPSGIYDLAGVQLPVAPTPLPAVAPIKHAGGKPPKAIWERVWIEIAARLYNGTLIPTKQADIEAAIMQISADLGDGVEIAAARRHAKPLWEKIKSDRS